MNSLNFRKQIIFALSAGVIFTHSFYDSLGQSPVKPTSEGPASDDFGGADTKMKKIEFWLKVGDMFKKFSENVYLYSGPIQDFNGLAQKNDFNSSIKFETKFNKIKIYPLEAQDEKRIMRWVKALNIHEYWYRISIAELDGAKYYFVEAMEFDASGGSYDLARIGVGVKHVILVSYLK